jgi:hypothetical protein
MRSRCGDRVESAEVEGDRQPEKLTAECFGGVNKGSEMTPWAQGRKVIARSEQPVPRVWEPFEKHTML